MAKQVGILPINGTIDGVNYYVRKGKPVARRAGGGFNGTKIKTSPSMVRVRENGSEFGHCSKVKKVFKDALFPFFKNYKDAELHGRMMQLFLAIKDLDLVSERGRRTIFEGLRNSEGLKLLKNYDFTQMPFPFEKNSYSYTADTFFIDSLDSKAIKFSKECTHLALHYGIVALNFSNLETTLYKSDGLHLFKNEIITNVQMTTNCILTENTIGIAIVSYRFVQEVNGTFYLLNDAKSFGLKVLGVYGL
jgi:hypothetical protein